MGPRGANRSSNFSDSISARRKFYISWFPNRGTSRRKSNSPDRISRTEFGCRKKTSLPLHRKPRPPLLRIHRCSDMEGRFSGGSRWSNLRQSIRLHRLVGTQKDTHRASRLCCCIIRGCRRDRKHGIVSRAVSRMCSSSLPGNSTCTVEVARWDPPGSASAVA